MNTIKVHKEGKATLVMIMIPTGAYYEDNRIKGISHFIEHMCFKGTKNRTHKEIDLAIERYGGDINAFTDWEITVYWAKIANQYKDIAIDVITDLATNPVFPAKEIDKEREVIVQELNMYRDNPSYDVCNLANEIYYPKDSGFHFPIVGTENSLQEINRTEILKYFQANYKTPTLIIIGDVENSVHMDSELLLGFPSSVVAKQPKRKTLETRTDISQSNVIITGDVYLSNYLKLKKAILLDLLSEVYSDMSGRLFSKVREEHNLVYRIHFSCGQFSNGLINWNVSLGLNKDKIDKAYDLIMKELTRPITNKELEIAMTKAIGSQALRTESASYLAENIAYALRSNAEWEDYLFNYDKLVNTCAKDLNEFLEAMNFKENILVGITPE